MSTGVAGLDAALGQVDPAAIARDAAALVRVPSVTGDERAALEALAAMAQRLGLRTDLHRHDLEALRADPGYPGEEAPRADLWGLAVTLEATTAGAQRLALNGHVDVVPPGTATWAHEALAAHERRLNERVDHELMAALALPYPMLVGRLEAGEWSSSVPDRLRFAGRAPVRVGEDVAAARRGVERAVAEAAPAGGPPVELTWPGGRFAPGETPADAPFAVLVRRATEAELGRDVPLAGVPWGADLRLWTARGVPCVMVGPRGFERAHAVDERVGVDDLAATARIAVRVIAGMVA